MGRPTIEGRYNFSTPDERRRFSRDTASLRDVYEVNLSPARDLRSNAQNRYWHGVVCLYLADYLTAQDHEITTVGDAHRILADKFLAVDVIDKETGEIAYRKIRSTASLNKLEFADLIDRSRFWLQDFFNIYTPDPMKYGVEQPGKLPPTARAPKEAHAV